MLQNMMQGIFTIKADLNIHSEYSAYLEKIFEKRDLADHNALELLMDRADVSADKRMQMQTVVEICLRGGGTGLEFAANGHLLLGEIVRRKADGHDQFLELDWQAIEDDDGAVDKLMVVVRDMTEIRELRHEAEQQRRELHILSRLINTGPQQTERFFSNTQEKFTANRTILQVQGQVSIEDLKLIFRNLHTIKGNARTLGFDEVADAVHHEEEIYAKALMDGGLMQKGHELLDGLQRCLDSVTLYEGVYHKTLKGLQSSSNGQESYHAFYDEVGRLLSRPESTSLRDQLAQTHERYRIDAQSQSLESILGSIRDSLPGLAQELQKVTPELKVTPCPVRFLPKAADIIGDVK
ncbi:MAG: Hpt domain-containing protein, partial [Pseudobdellovibrionaceae bacterium]|nr:Hpt domain-containing protein [Pseudobdellovibrionaceae bacterium]